MVSIGVTLGGNGEPTTEVFTDELADYFCCIVNNEIIGEPMEFKGGISRTTGYSGYPFNGSRKGAVYCKSNDIKGKWLTIIETADLFGIDKYDLIPTKSVEEVIKEEPVAKERTQSNSKKEICKIDGKCYPM